MPISTDEALASYGFVYNLASSIPELKGYLDQAIQGGWTPDKLTATIQSSGWWRSNADTVRNLVTMQATDPATYERNLSNATQLVVLKAMQLGRNIDMGAARGLALRTLSENGSWDDQRLNWEIGFVSTVQRGEGGSYLGQAAGLTDHMQQTAKAYGVPYSDQWLTQWVNDIEVGSNSLDAFDQTVKARAKAAFPQFANQIDAGMTIRDIADPYISTMAKTLEIDEGNITLDDRYVKQALAQTGQDGATRTSMPLWQFERTLKDDPRYDKTNQAKDDAFSTLAQIGRDWGFTGGGK